MILIGLDWFVFVGNILIDEFNPNTDDPLLKNISRKENIIPFVTELFKGRSILKQKKPDFCFSVVRNLHACMSL